MLRHIEDSVERGKSGLCPLRLHLAELPGAASLFYYSTFLYLADPSPSSAKSSGLLRGIKPFMNQLEELLNQEMSRGSAQTPSGGITISVTPKPNAMEVLLVGSHPIRPKDMAAHKKLLVFQEESFR